MARRSNASYCTRFATQPKLGLLKPNELGIYDMSDNLWEWCLDKWNGLIYEYTPANFQNPLLLDDYITDSNAVVSSIENYIKTRGSNRCVMWGDVGAVMLISDFKK